MTKGAFVIGSGPNGLTGAIVPARRGSAGMTAFGLARSVEVLALSAHAVDDRWRARDRNGA